MAAAPPHPPAYEDLLTVPVSTRDLAVVVARDARRRPSWSAAAREAGAPLVRSVRVFDRYAGEQVGEGRVSLALRLELADPGRTLTDDEIDAAVGRVREALEAAARGCGRRPAVHVFGARPASPGAQLAELVDRHPALRARRHHRARRRRAGAWWRSPPSTACERRLEAPDVEAVGAGDFAAVCYPHAEAAALVAELVDRGARVLDVSADHRLRDAALYPAVYGFEHPRPDLLAEAVYGLPERYRDRIAAPAWSPTRAASPRRACSPCCRWRARSPTWSSTPRAA